MKNAITEYILMRNRYRYLRKIQYCTAILFGGITLLTGCVWTTDRQYCVYSSTDRDGEKSYSLGIKEEELSLIGYDGGFFVTKKYYDYISLPPKWTPGKEVPFAHAGASEISGLIYVPIDLTWVKIDIKKCGVDSEYNGKHKLQNTSLKESSLKESLDHNKL